MAGHRAPRVRRRLGVLGALCLLATTPALGPAEPARAGGLVAGPAVSAGGAFTCAVTSSHAAVCWGSNDDGALGDGTTTSSRSPVGVSGLGSGVASVAAGRQHACALTMAGGVRCWGNGANGRLGNGSTANSSTPVDVTGLASGVVSIAAGVNHTCALTDAGGVRCWGANNRGQLGNGSLTASSVPVDVSGLGSGVGAVAAGGAFSCARTDAGAVSCWGKNTDGELGDDTNTDASVPVATSGLSSGVTSLATGVSHACAVRSGAALCWGVGTSGALGNGSTAGSKVPVGVSGLSAGVADVTANENVACARTTAGGASCWGANGSGQLGNSSTSSSTTPVPVTGQATGVSAITAGAAHGCTLSTAGVVRCWGANAVGQLGDGTVASSSAPVGVYGLSTGLLRVTTSPAVPSQITVDGQIADSWGLAWLKVAPGDHEVCFGAIAGFATPACQHVVVAVGSTSAVEATFVARGYLRVLTSPAVPAQIEVDGAPRDNWGMWTDIPVGAHEVCFGPVAGFTPPACQQVEVTAGTTTTVTGTFAESSGQALEGVGFLRVTTDPPIPTQISVDGAPADSWGLSWLELAPGSHTVCFSRVEGYETPSCSSVDVAVGTTTSFTPSMPQRGFLVVQTSPPAPATITVNGVAVDDWGNFTDRPPGGAHVCFGYVPGRTTPPCQDVVVVAGQLTTVTGTYP